MYMKPKPPSEDYVRARRLLNVLWTKAVGTPGYKKSEWIELDNLLDKLERKSG